MMQTLAHWSGRPGSKERQQQSGGDSVDMLVFHGFEVKTIKPVPAAVVARRVYFRDLSSFLSPCQFSLLMILLHTERSTLGCFSHIAR